MDDHEQEETSCRTSDHIETKTKHESSKKSKRRKTEKSQKYAILPPVVVTNIAESIGIDDLPENVSSALAEDATFKLRELISNCATLLKNQRRKKLLTEDVNRVLEIADVGRIYGHNAPDECGFTFIEDAGIYIQEDHKVDVVAMALNDLTLTQKKVQCITGTRVVLDPVEQRKEKTGDGHAAAAAAAATAGTSSSAGEVGSNSNAGEDTSSNAGEGTSLNAGEGTNSNTSGGTSPSAGEGTSTDPQDTSTKSSAKSSETNKHSQELLNYYIQVARAILGGSTSLLKVALKDLMSNPRIGPVCPYFFNLIALSINKLPRHDWLTNALLSTVEAILENPYVDPSSYLAAKRTINSLLVIAIEPKVAKNCDDFLLRTRAARLLSEVLDAWNIDQKIQNDIVRQLMQLLLDKKISLQTQFGAIYSLISLEHFSLSSHFWPVIGRYIPILEEKQNSDVLLATQVGGCIQLAAAKMYIDEWTQDVTVDEWKRRLKVDHMLYEHFGDALVPIRQDFSITGPYFYSKPNGNFEESFPTEEEDQPTYDPTSAVNMEVEDTSSNNVTPAINFTKNSPIVFKIEHARQIELKMNRKLCSIQMPLYTESPKSFRSIWNRQTLYKNTRTIKYCVESHLKSPAGYLYLIL